MKSGEHYVAHTVGDLARGVGLVGVRGTMSLMMLLGAFIGVAAGLRWLGIVLDQPLYVGFRTVFSWVGLSQSYQELTREVGAWWALALFLFPFAAYLAWMRAWGGPMGPDHYRKRLILACVACALAAGIGRVPQQTALAASYPGALLRDREGCLEGYPDLLTGRQRPGRMLGTCQAHLSQAQMDGICLPQVRKPGPLRFPYQECKATAERLTGLVNWPVDPTRPGWAGADVNGPAPDGTTGVTPEQQRAALLAKGIQPLR